MRPPMLTTLFRVLTSGKPGVLRLDIGNVVGHLGVLRVRLAAGGEDRCTLRQAMGALVVQRRDRICRGRLLCLLLLLCHHLLLARIAG